MNRLGRCAVLGALLALVALPAFGVAEVEHGRLTTSPLLAHLSQGVAARVQLERSGRVSELRQLVRGAAARAQAQARGVRGIGNRFNRDSLGLPQNEEAVTVCRNRPSIVLGGTNDYRGLLDPLGNFTGWYFSRDGGRTVAKEGLLPEIRTRGKVYPSSGDPAVQSDERCNLYFADLNYTVNPQTGSVGEANSIGLYKTTPATLASCRGGREPTQLSTPGCWPNRRTVATGALTAGGLFGGGAGHFLDKEWLDVGRSGTAGKVVWVAFADFTITPSAPLGFSGAKIKAVRCDAELRACTRPILISGADQDIQNADVTIAADGRTMISWNQIQGELEQTAQVFTIKVRIAPPGSTRFGPTHVVAREQNPLPAGGFLHANDFRTTTYPKSIMPMVNGHARLYVTWDRCRFRLLDTVCEEPELLLSHSDNAGRTWSRPLTISRGGDNYFPAISDEIGSRNFVIAYYTNRFDRVFHNRQDVEMVTIDAATSRIVHRQRITGLSNETEADPILGGFFIGDYFDVQLLRGMVYVNYNANYRSVRVLGQGLPVPQQDNFLKRVRS
jgi:hypothetical protein